MNNCPAIPPYQVLTDVLSSGRTSRLVSELVIKERKLLAVSSEAEYPGEKHAGLAVVYGRPINGVWVMN
jgi:predicted Zn-dependent peptidase